MTQSGRKKNYRRGTLRLGMKRIILIVLLTLVNISLAADEARKGYVLKPGEGEALGPSRLIKASPQSGTQGGVIVLDQLRPGFQTTFHIHTNADEFFYVVGGEGRAADGFADLDRVVAA